ncbi:MAG TPA: TIGR04219 family outer membrane beta-barrel protein [Campylobacterales bacterium]|nr:TIGR04219 family outer membrane beta-barrel protein [Campylobacterales bacterium]
MKKLLALTTLWTTLSMADFVGGEVNLGFYTHAPSGSASYEGETIDVEDDLKWEQENDIFFKAYLEHPLPLIPNIKVGYTNFSHSGSGAVGSGFSWGDVNFLSSSDIKSQLEIAMYDLTLYYEILDNWLNADIGVNIKYLDGNIDVKGENRITHTVESESTDFALPIPMAYAKFRLDVPTTDISFQAEGNYITFDGHTLYDFEAGIRYTYMLGLGIEAGYKGLKIEIDDLDNLTMDTDFSGVYGKLVWDF